jgi:cytochrome P450
MYLLTKLYRTTIEFNRQIYPIDNQLIVALNGHDLHYDAKYFSDPCQFRPERWTGVNNQVPRSYFRAFGRGARACLGQNLSQNELKVVLLMTMRDYTFECANLKPNVKPKTPYTDMDTVYGDIIFQELGLEAKPRGGMMMRVRKPA